MNVSDNINKKRIFLDYAAGHDNPNAIYLEGRKASIRLENARKKIANVLSAAHDEVHFIASGASTLEIMLGRYLKSGDHVVTSQIEHESLLEVFGELEKRGVKITYIRPDKFGLMSAESVAKAIRKSTKLVSIMYANNEIGTIQPIKEIARMFKNRKPGFRFILHSDCVQAPGLLPINVQSLGVDLATFSAAKFGGPAGVGFLYQRRWTKELLKSPSENIGISVAESMAGALQQTLKLNKPNKLLKLEKLRDYFIDQTLTWLPGLQVNGTCENRLASNVNIVLPIEAELAVIELDIFGIAASVGAACSNVGDCEKGSHVILALGKNEQEAKSSVRFSLGRLTSRSEIDYVIKILVSIINRHKTLWPSRIKQ